MRLLTFFLSLPVLAQTITFVSANGITERSARINMTLSAPASVYVQSGPTTSYGNRSTSVSSSSSTAVVTIYGLAPASTVHFRICQIGQTPPTGCTADQTLTTLAASTWEPTPPTAVDTTYPASFGDSSGLVVSADCSNFWDKVQDAKARDGNTNWLISIPAGTVCGGSWDMPAKSGTNSNGSGYIVIATAGTISPAGSRISPLFYDSGQMVRFLHSYVDSGFNNESGPNPATCRPTSYQWRADLTTWFGCFSANTWTQLDTIPGNTRSTSAPSPSACDHASEIDHYHIKSDGGRDVSLFYCHASLQWVWLRGGATSPSPQPTGYTFNFGSGVKGYRLVGLKFDNAIETYSEDNPYILVDPGASNIIVDRVYAYNQRTSGGRPINLDGTNVAVIDSYLDMVSWGREGFQASGIRFSTGPGPAKVYNNYISNCFIPIFSNDYAANDITIERNTIRLQEACNPDDDAWNGRNTYDTRANAEFKFGRRLRFRGNIFENLYTNLAVGASILFTPRAGSSSGDGGEDNPYGISDVLIDYNIFRNGAGGGVEIWGNDNVGYRGVKPTSRVTFRNNLGHGISHGVLRNPMLYIQDGIEKLQVLGNTWYNNIGTSPAFLMYTGPFSGLDYRNNILWINQGTVIGDGDGDGGGIRNANATFTTLCDGITTTSGATAKTRLDKCALSGTTADYTFRNNAIVGGVDGYTGTYSGTYPTGNHWPGDTTAGIAALSFRDVAAGNYALKLTSTYAPNGIGVDMDALRAAQGTVYNQRALSVTSSGATLYWTAPDETTVCTVEYGTSATPGTGTRVTDTPAGRFRSKAITGLSGGTAYNARIYCGQMVSVSFTTH